MDNAVPFDDVLYAGSGGDVGILHQGGVPLEVRLHNSPSESEEEPAGTTLSYGPKQFRNLELVWEMAFEYIEFFEQRV